MDVLHKVLKMLDYERGKFIGVIIGVVIIISLVGCDLQVKSPISGDKVTRTEFKAEVVNVESLLENERLDIEKAQQAYNKKVALLNDQTQTAENKFIEAEKFRDGFVKIASGAAMTIASGGTLSTPEILISLLTLAGIGGTIGGVYDSSRKNNIIAKTKATTTAGA